MHQFKLSVMLPAVMTNFENSFLKFLNYGIFITVYLSLFKSFVMQLTSLMKSCKISF